MAQSSDFDKLMRDIDKQAGRAFWSLIRKESYNIDDYIPTPGIINGYRATCLGHAASRGDIDLVKLCLARNANPNLGSIWKEYDGSISCRRHTTVLVAQSNENSKEILDLLLQAGATPSQHDKEQILHEAVWPLKLPLVKWCLETNTDPNSITYNNGPTPLFLMCDRWDYDRTDEYIEAVILLLKAGANQNTQCNLSSGVKNWRDYISALVVSQIEKQI